MYGGPVVAVVDANTYSAGDLFAAGFYDNEIGTLITVGEATGAGGANVWSPERRERRAARDARSSSRCSRRASATPSRSAGRRRAGDFDGAAIEDVGVQGHRSYAMTRRDLTGNNGDLRAMCGRLLATQPLTGLELTLRETTVRAAAKGLDRLDVYVDGRPVGWHDLSNEGKVTRSVDVRAPPR